jgi:hypothetical protein
MHAEQAQTTRYESLLVDLIKRAGGVEVADAAPALRRQIAVNGRGSGRDGREFNQR